MIPTFTETPIIAEFPSYLNLPYDPLRQIVLGGVALNDGSKGRNFQQWEISSPPNSTLFNIKPLSSSSVVLTVNVGQIITAVSLAFDANMSPVVGYQTVLGSYLYFVDSLSNQFTTMQIPGTSHCKVFVDDQRPISSAVSDVIFVYILNNSLYSRVQRERYQVERVVGPTNGSIIEKAGLNIDNRVQIKVM